MLSSTGVLSGTEDMEGVVDFGGVVGWTNSVKPVADIMWRDEWWNVTIRTYTTDFYLFHSVY